jgi:protein-tyrosine-phosphatase
MTAPKILFVCTGNTCRSAMAEAIWRAMGYENVGSAGVMAWSGQPAAPPAVEVVKRYQATLTAHRSRDLREVREDYDLVLTMTQAQRRQVIEARPDWADRTWLLSEAAGESGEIADPAGQDFAVYETVAEEIYGLLQKLKEKWHDTPGPGGPATAPPGWG